MDPIRPVFTVEPPRHPSSQPPRPKRGGIIGMLIAGGLVLWKIAAPLLLFLKTGGSMLLSIGAYSLIYGWKFAAGFVVLIFVHEMGHFIAAKAFGIPVSAPVFIPFFGAYVLLQRAMPLWINAIISYAGPLAGGLGGWVCLLIAALFDLEWLMAVALYTFILNLINLLPIPSLDGSFVWGALFRQTAPALSPTQRVYLGALLVVLIGGLVLGCRLSWGHLPPPGLLN